MSTPYPPQPRRLMRDPSKKLIGGVCSGVAKYLNMDVNLVRILTVLISLFTGIPIVLYIIALFVLPEERDEPQPPYINGPQAGAYGAGYAAQPPYGQPTYGQPTYDQPAQPPANDVWGPGGAPWEQPQTAAPASAPASTPAPTPTQDRQAWQQPPAEPAEQPTWQQPPVAAAPVEAAESDPVAQTEGAEPAESQTSTTDPAAAAPDSPEDADKNG